MIEKSSVKERLMTFLRYLEVGQRKFEMTCGLSNGYINNIKQSISPAKLSKITSTYPELNAGWLMTGEGEMLKSSVSQSANGNNVTQVAGNGNRVNSACSLDKALDEIAEQRKLVAKSQEQITKSQEQISKSQEQIDRLLNIIEQMTKQSS